MKGSSPSGTPGSVSRRSFLAGAGVLAAATALVPLIGRPETGATRIPASLRWPAEWERHERTLMSMPFDPWIYYGKERLEACQREWAAVAQAIAHFEPVTMVIPRRSRADMRRLLGPDVGLLVGDYNDGWLRDNGPIFLTDGSSRVGLDWEFDGWGGAFGQPYSADDALPDRICTRLDIPRQQVPVVMEGGSLICDGQGTIITTEECLLNPNRNPSMTKAEIESALLTNFHAQKVIWLPYGLLGDLTGGHVDGVAMFAGPARVVVQTDPNNAVEDARLQANLSVLQSTTDASGRSFDIELLPFLPRGKFGVSNKAISHTFINFYPTNRKGLIVPTTGRDRDDRKGLRRLREIFPDRKVVGVVAPNLNWAGGGVHCITQQVPVA